MGEKRKKRASRKRDRQCRACGERGKLTVHHIVPRRNDGATEPENLLTLCRNCHNQWHRCEGYYYRLPFFEWIQGGRVRRLAQQKSKLLGRIATARWTGQSYSTVALQLNELGLQSPRACQWTPPNLASWVRRSAPELVKKEAREYVRWPFFAETLAPGVWRWYFFDQPLGVCHYRGETRVLDKYNFSRYFQPNQKTLNHMRPADGLHVCHGSFDLQADSVRPAVAHGGPEKQIVAFLSEGRLRRARRTAGQYHFSGPIRRMPEGWAEHEGWSWVSWSRVEPILVEKAVARVREFQGKMALEHI